jgi:hypothetical protein
MKPSSESFFSADVGVAIPELSVDGIVTSQPQMYQNFVS